MPFVVVGHGAAPSLFEGQPGLGAIQGLDPRFLIHTQECRLIPSLAAISWLVFLEVAIVGTLFQVLHGYVLHNHLVCDIAG